MKLQLSLVAIVRQAFAEAQLPRAGINSVTKKLKKLVTIQHHNPLSPNLSRFCEG